METSLYIHIPFCRKRCHYCDFNTYAGKEALIPAYIDALCQEIRIVGEEASDINIQTIYLGGGTPSIIPLPQYKQLFETIRDNYSVTEDCEVTIEANPGTLTLPYLSGLMGLGINRISMGVQSTDSFDLTRLDRIHSIDDILISNRNARKAGFTNVSYDLIFGLPWQDMASWEQSLERVIFLKPDHLSLYSLIIESGTMLAHWYERGLIECQDQDTEADMYEMAMQRLQKTGYEQYEISNWARQDSHQDYRCRHNLQYWLNQPYLGFGAGAHGYAAGIRTVNTETIPDYMDRINQGLDFIGEFPRSPAMVSAIGVDQQTQMKDFMMLGLRLIREGVSEERFRKTYGMDMTTVFSSEIDALMKNDLVEWVNPKSRRLCLTPRGVMVANQAFMAFV